MTLRRICFAAVVLAAVTARADTGPGQGFQLIEEPVNPRLVAMGSAGTAFPGGGFFLYNPAMPLFLDKSYLSVQYGGIHEFDSRLSDLNRAVLEPVFVIGDWFAGAGFYTQGTDFTPATEQGPIDSLRGTAQTTQIALDIGYKHSRWAAALCFNGLQDRIGDYSYYGLSLSAGIGYWLIPQKLSLGAAGFHAGITRGAITPDDRWGGGPPLPLSARAGAAWQDTLKGVPYNATLDIVYRLDKTREQAKRVLVPVGVEVWPVKYLALRLGKRLFHDSEIVNFGAGVRISPLSVDAGFVVSSDETFRWLVGLTYTLEPRPAAATPNAP